MGKMSTCPRWGLKKAAAAAFVMGLAICILGMPAIAFAQAEEDEGVETSAVGAKAAVLIELNTGTVLYSYNADVALPMASTTKVMTALLAIEYDHMDELVTCSANAFGVPGTSIYLEQGEQLTLEEMLYGLMLASGNDAAVAIAEHIGGTVEGFCQMMTDRAAELGCKDTVFYTPHGLPNANHHTTANDLALIAREAMSYPFFRQLVSTQRATVSWNSRAYDRVLTNKNKLLSNYAGATGIKTGYTKAAGRCLVFGAKREELEVVGVVLNCSTWFDTAAIIMDEAFEKYQYVSLFQAGESLRTLPILEGIVGSVNAVILEDLAAPMEYGQWPEIEIDLPDFVDAGVIGGQTLGSVKMVYNGEVIAQQPIVAERSVPRSTFRTYLKRVIDGWVLYHESNGEIDP